MSDTHWPITLIHKALTQEHDWLNTQRPLTAEDLAGRMILIDFWTFCCINCIHVIPDLQYLEHKFGNKLTVIGVHSAKFRNEQDRNNIRAAIIRYGIEHPVVNDKDFVIWQSFSVHAWPTFVLITPAGRVDTIYSGEGHRKALEFAIDRLIKEYTTTIQTAPLPIALEKDKVPETFLRFPGKLEFVQDFQGSPALFIADSGNNRILGARLSGEVFLEIGNGTQGNRDGSFTQAQFNTPQGLTYHDTILYVADMGNNSIRRIDLLANLVQTLDTTRGFSSPWDIILYPSDNELTIAMAGTHQLWVYDLTTQLPRVIAGNGRESIDDGAYPFNTLAQPSGLSVDRNKLYFVDAETSSLRVFFNGIVSTLIGTGLFDFGYAEGKRGVGLLQHPLGLDADHESPTIYIADSYNHAIRRFDRVTQELKNYSGTGQPGSVLGTLEQTQYNEPNDIVIGQGLFYIADTNNHRILILDPVKRMVSLFNIMPKKPAPLCVEPELLPNLKKSSPIEVASGKPITVYIGTSAIEINREGPSSLALFDASNYPQQMANLIREYTRADILKKKIILPALEPTKQYLLQGTIYYCTEQEKGECLLISYNQELIARSSSSETELHLP